MARQQAPILDFHSHILPQVDHGSASPEQSEKMFLQAQKAGVVAVVATPHFYPSVEAPSLFLKRRNDAYNCLKNYYAEKGSQICPIILGAEVAIEKELLEIDDLRSLCIGKSNYILMEMPKSGRFHTWMYDFLYRVESEHGLRVILAHVDRYSPHNTEKLLDLGFAAQVNASSLVTGKERRILLNYCEEGLIEFLGSDAHDDKKRCYKSIKACSKKIDPQLLAYFYNNSIEALGL